LTNKTKTFRSNGKLLLTGEYVVLDGAKALAIPTAYGQSLTVEENKTKNIVWKSYNELDTLWFEDEFLVNDSAIRLRLTAKNYTDVSKRLIQILRATYDLNPEFLNSKQGYTITTHQDFNRLWGLGTSSTLVNNIANWANVDAYKLLEKTFKGSGYDIACAQNDTPITYQLRYRQKPLIESIGFDPSFKSQLYFVYLNEKQNSRDGIAAYKKKAKVDAEIIDKINLITEAILSCESLSNFETLITTHEAIISKLIDQKPIKTRLFHDFKGAVKSLGAWGGDFVLVTSETDPTAYFNSKGFGTVIPYSDMILEK
jgi:mevalonate kinase